MDGSKARRGSGAVRELPLTNGFQSACAYATGAGRKTGTPGVIWLRIGCVLTPKRGHFSKLQHNEIRKLHTTDETVTPEAEGSSPFDPASNNKGLADEVSPFFVAPLPCPTVFPTFTHIRIFLSVRAVNFSGKGSC